MVQSVERFYYFCRVFFHFVLLICVRAIFFFSLVFASINSFLRYCPILNIVTQLICGSFTSLRSVFMSTIFTVYLIFQFQFRFDLGNCNVWPHFVC